MISSLLLLFGHVPSFIRSLATAKTWEKFSEAAEADRESLEAAQ